MRPLFTTNNAKFAKFAIATVAASSALGWMALQLVQSAPPSNNNDKNSKMSQDEAMVRAMIQNAQSSTWQENVENAVMAQERFVLPGRGNSQDQERFLQDISKKRNEIMRKQQEFEQQEEKDQTEIFTTTWKKE